ncbi:hypothetical protein LEP1GSC188_1906 [Leptospira weilii serovar Topaz str. LT2116]|uniref:Uncharacterized protein n=1 Tax=Leptospira weilii serovar Topaz str. LT2116 TaxID=1088540 RepID=M3G4F8_9LEPT|nr:hypothetical protein LEP1GSC188_1906 [Leptospira weilii serovar Topaz str. LT2116]
MNEFSFLKNAHVFGLDVICENRSVLAGDEAGDVECNGSVVGETRRWGRVSFGSDPRGPSGPAVGIGRKGSEGRDRKEGIGRKGSEGRDRKEGIGRNGIGRKGSEGRDRKEGIGRKGSEGRDRKEGIGRKGSEGRDRKEGIGRKGFALRKNDSGSKNWFHSLIQEFEYFPRVSVILCK